MRLRISPILVELLDDKSALPKTDTVSITRVCEAGAFPAESNDETRHCAAYFDAFSEGFITHSETERACTLSYRRDGPGLDLGLSRDAAMRLPSWQRRRIHLKRSPRWRRPP